MSQDFRTLVEMLPEALVVGQAGRLVFANRELCRLLRYKNSCSPVDQPLDALVPPEARAELDTILATASAVDEPTRPHVQLLCRADGSSVHGRLLARAIQWQGSPAVLLLLHPLPASNRPPELLSLLETAVDHLSDMIMITEADSLQRQGRRIIYVNKAFCDATGYDPDEVIGKTPNLTIGPETDVATLTRISKELNEGRSVEAELLKYRKDGSTYYVDLEIVPVLDSDGIQSQWVSVHRDVTERKRMQATLASTERLAALGRLAAGVGHEINNPLAYLVSNLVYAIEGLEDTSAARIHIQPILEALREARDGAERVRKIVRDLRQLSMGLADEPGPSDLLLVLESSLSIARNELRNRARVVQEIDELPPVDMNQHRLGQVLLNLLLNAAEAIPLGAADRHTVTIRASADGDMVVLEVQDDGPGVPDAIKGRIFDPFFTTKVGTGTGLGLSICHSIVTSAGGTIEVETGTGSGCLFRVRLPAKGVVTADPRRGRGAHLPREPAGRVLVVDDEPLVLRSLERTLGRDHRVTTVATARGALEVLAQQNFDAILFDIMMPEMTGMELFRRVERKYPGAAERVVFITGGSVNDEVSAFLAGSGRRYLEKPYDPSELRRLVGTMVRDPTSRATTPSPAITPSSQLRG
ncbi:MAG: PAS domain S-box protein [Nannocystaceae bacterium]